MISKGEDIVVLIKGCGGYLPKKRLTNRDLESRLDTSHEWILERTGIEARHIADPEETTSFLATQASLLALEKASLTAQDIDLIVCATATPDLTFPSTAVLIQKNLKLTHGAAFDVNAVCSGFIYALAIANNFLKLGQGKRALVVGAEIFSRILDWNDRTTCVLFGDGAGAVVLEAQEKNVNNSTFGILSTHLHSDGEFSDILKTTGGPATTGAAGVILMQGREVFKHAIQKMTEGILEALTSNNLSVSDIAWLVPHQANKRIMDAVSKKLDLDPSKVIVTIGDHSNTSAASIPLALTYGQDKGLFKPGDLIVLEALGGGLTWGSAVIRW